MSVAGRGEVAVILVTHRADTSRHACRAALRVVALSTLYVGVGHAQGSPVAHGPRNTPRVGSAWCTSNMPTATGVAGCELALRYLRAELAGDIWTGNGNPDIAPGDSGPALGLPGAVNLYTGADVGIDARPCAVSVLADTLTVLVQYGQIGGVADQNTEPEYTFGPIMRYRKGTWVGYYPLRWVVRPYRAAYVDDRWRLLYVDRDPLIGIRGAVRVYRGHHRAQFRQQMEQAAAKLRPIPRPACPTFASWKARAEP